VDTILIPLTFFFFSMLPLFRLLFFSVFCKQCTRLNVVFRLRPFVPGGVERILLLSH